MEFRGIEVNNEDETFITVVVMSMSSAHTMAGRMAGRMAKCLRATVLGLSVMDSCILAGYLTTKSYLGMPSSMRRVLKYNGESRESSES
jgi:hypothetical protein